MSERGTGAEAVSAGGDLLRLLASEDAADVLSPDEQRIVDHYWAEHAVPLTDEQRQRFIAAAERGFAYRRRRLLEWRVLLYTIHWWLSGKEPTWHDYYDCPKCHPWPSVQWVGPYVNGDSDDQLPAPGSSAATPTHHHTH